MMSRVQCIEQIFIVDNLKESKIMMSRDALEELQRLELIVLGYLLFWSLPVTFLCLKGNLPFVAKIS